MSSCIECYKFLKVFCFFILVWIYRRIENKIYLVECEGVEGVGFVFRYSKWWVSLGSEGGEGKVVLDIWWCVICKINCFRLMEVLGYDLYIKL